MPAHTRTRTRPHAQFALAGTSNLLRFLIDTLARAHPECLALPAELDIVKVRGPLAGLPREQRPVRGVGPVLCFIIPRGLGYSRRPRSS
jgi:hypothetical protein